MQSDKRVGFLQRIMLVFMAFFMMFIGVCPPTMSRPVISAEAATPTTFYIQTAIDTSSWQIAAGVVNDKKSQFGSFAEAERIGEDGLKNLLTSDQNQMFVDLISGTVETNGGKGSTDKRVLSFPGFSTQKLLAFTTPPASAAMQDRAMYIKDHLVFDLNTAINIVYPDIKKGSESPKTMDDFKGKLVNILNVINGGTVNGWEVSTVSGAEYTDEANGVNASCYRKFKKGSAEYVLMVSIPKYLDSMQTADKPEKPGEDDTVYITWGTIIYEALVNSTLKEDAVTADGVYDSTVQGVLEEAVSNFMASMLHGLRSILGLWNLDDLIFNKGVRGSTAYVSGIFPSSWETFIWTFFLITEIVSFAIIMFAIVKHIANKAASTVNPAIRANAMEQVKDMAIGIILLVMLPGLLIALMKISASLVNVFGAMVSDKSVTDELAHFSTGSSIAAVILGFANLIINIYFNWFYIIRGITVALLIILAPVFVSWMCVGVDKRSISIRWFSELISNIFIQPIHAMLFAFIGLVPGTGRPVETLVMLYCLIPLTALLKGLMFPGTNEMAHGMASRAGARANDMAKNISRRGVSAAAGGVAGGIGGAIAGAKAAKAVNSGESSGNVDMKQKSVNTETSPSTKGNPKLATLKNALAGAGIAGIKKGTAATAKSGGKAGSESDSSEGIQTKNPNGETANPVASGIHSTSDKANQVVDSESSAGAKSVPADFKENMSDRMSAAKTKQSDYDSSKPSALKNIQSPSDKMAEAKRKMIFAAARAGAVSGWKGQLIGMHPTQSPAVKQHLNEYKEAAAEQAAAEQKNMLRNQRSEDPTTGGSTMPYQNMGGFNVTSKDSFEANGGTDLMTRHGQDGKSMSYKIAGYDLDPTTKDLFQRATSGKMEDQAVADKLNGAGYNINKVKDADGRETGMYSVEVGQNQYTGASAPEVNEGRIMHGGSYNDLMPNEHKIDQQIASMPATRTTGSDGYVNMAPGKDYGSYTASAKDTLARGGFQNLHSGHDSQGSFASYEMATKDMPAEQQQLMSKLSSNDPAYAEIKDQYSKAGITVASQMNPDGSDSGKVRVTVRDNQYTGAAAPVITNDQVLHGGLSGNADYNSLMPREDIVAKQASLSNTYQQMSTRVAQDESSLNNRMAMTSQSARSVQDAMATVGNSNNAVVSASAFNSDPVSSYASNSGLILPDSAPQFKQTVTSTQMSNAGVQSFQMASDGVNSTTVYDPKAATNQDYQIIAHAMEQPADSPTRIAVMNSLQSQGFSEPVYVEQQNPQTGATQKMIQLSTNHDVTPEVTPCTINTTPSGETTYSFDNHGAAFVPNVTLSNDRAQNETMRSKIVESRFQQERVVIQQRKEEMSGSSVTTQEQSHVLSEIESEAVAQHNTAKARSRSSRSDRRPSRDGGQRREQRHNDPNQKRKNHNQNRNDGPSRSPFGV